MYVVKYQNNQGQYISEIETSLLTDYYILYFLNDLLKIKKETFGGEPFLGEYYLSIDEDITNIIGGLDSSYKWFFVTQDIVNTYAIKEKRSYNENLQPSLFFFKEVRDSNDKFIALIKYNTETNQSIGAFKVFRYQEEEITFSFKEDGQIEKIDLTEMILSNELSYNNLDSFLNEIEEFKGSVITE